MEWIKAKDRIPEHTDELILYYDGNVFCAWFDGNKKYFVIDNDSTIVYPDEENVYWMPLPDKPKVIGKFFRLPTKEEFDKLISHFTRWNAEKKGLEILNDEGEILFLPADGYYDGNSRNDVGSGGYYWSSTKNENYSSLAYNLYFHASNKYMDDYNCLYARSIRLVSESPFEGGIKFGNIYWKPKNEKEYYSFSAALEKWG